VFLRFDEYGQERSGITLDIKVCSPGLLSRRVTSKEVANSRTSHSRILLEIGEPEP
jgi:hypothetical protein